MLPLPPFVELGYLVDLEPGQKRVHFQGRREIVADDFTGGQPIEVQAYVTAAELHPVPRRLDRLPAQLGPQERNRGRDGTSGAILLISRRSSTRLRSGELAQLSVPTATFMDSPQPGPEPHAPRPDAKRRR